MGAAPQRACLEDFFTEQTLLYADDAALFPELQKQQGWLLPQPCTAETHRGCLVPGFPQNGCAGLGGSHIVH